MTRSSTKELLTPFKEPEREFRSSRKHFKTLSPDESRSPDFDLFSDQEEYSEEEVVETMAETMEKYMSKTRADYGSGKMEEINNFQQEPNEKIYQAWEKFKELLMKCPQHYLTKTYKVVLFYNGLDVPTRKILDSRGAIPSKTAADAKDVNNVKVPTTPKISLSRKKGKPSKKLTTLNLVHLFKEGDIEQLLRDSTKGTMQTLHTKNDMEETLSKFIGESTKIHEENSNLIRKIRPSQKLTRETMSSRSRLLLKLMQARYTVLDHTNTPYPLDRTVLGYRTVKYPKGIVENVLVGIGKYVFPVDFIIIDMPKDIKVPLILERPFLSIAHAKIDVFKKKITLRVGEEKIIFTSVKPASRLIKRVYMLSLRERMELDLEVRLIGETLVLNRSLDLLFGDYIELNDLNVPLELRRDQVDDLMPTIEEGEVIEEFRARNDVIMVSEIFGYPSDCDNDKKIRIDCAHNLKFSCMMGFEFLHANFFPILYVNVMSKKFYNSIRKDKLEYKGNNVVGALMNIPFFVGTFSILTDFAVLEDMDAYRDDGIGDVIFGEPF
nr:hypothetical protein [Tanacetum cinerariifolium]